MLTEYGLEITIYIILIGAIFGYAVLDGFDLGVGMLHLGTKNDTHRRIFLNAIGPVWDGNEVWLIVVVGLLFAAFPHVFATALSGFYIPVMVLLLALTLRAVSIEFRSKREMPAWRWFWDILFFTGSLLISFGMGLFFGNLIQGMPLTEARYFDPAKFGVIMPFITPYTVLVGVFTISTFLMHGCIYLLAKTEGDLHDKLRDWARGTIIFFCMMYVLSTMATLIYFPHMVESIRAKPYLFFVAVVNMLLIANIPRCIYKGKDGWAFISSAGNILCLVALYALGTFPVIIRSTIDPATRSLTVFNSNSSFLTLKYLFIISCISIPLVIFYGIVVYRIFQGKVKINSMSY
ncbi:cytochrome d ubiquinol oxidase subunit II [Simkania negevensis]|uniref:Cytochrome d ubiquinol oxidase subunit II n=1 Tax=Simkania negevensis TaxID=83561 RepID=A0ABS3AR08_9BACT|nr:cytochrome d ubiquinol oxidase subunit II [Simkania negevensis]